MPTPTELLTKDHRKVEGLFEQYQQSADRSVVQQICTELMVHTAIEEKVVYPVLASDVPNGGQMERHAESEHKEVEDAVKQVMRLGYSGSEVDALMQRIIHGVTEHVQEEENEVLPAMEAALDRDKLETLGSKLQQAKQDEMSKMDGQGALVDLTKSELYEMAKEKGIDGRSDMNKSQLIDALQSS